MTVAELIARLQTYPGDYRVQHDAWDSGSVVGDSGESIGYAAGEITNVQAVGDISGHGTAVEIS